MLLLRLFGIVLMILTIGRCPAQTPQNSLPFATDTLQYHLGFVLYDPEKKENLISINGAKYFTPASNTKIFTLYAGLKILRDSVPALRFINRNDSLIFWGLGDPSFLYTDVFQNQKVFNFLKNASGKLVFADGNFFEPSYGPGWSWDDYLNYYQAERSAFPVYGNLISLSHAKEPHPPFFKSQSSEWGGEKILNRDRTSNHLQINKNKIRRSNNVAVPFITSGSLTAQLLGDTLKRKVEYTSWPLAAGSKSVFSIPTDSLYKVMMRASDNFIAEQILLMCAQQISDSLKTEIAIKKTEKDFLSDLPDKPVWVDGSGLSRYNQFTPRSIISLWEKIYLSVPRERLFSLLASNGKTGTLGGFLKNYPPIVFGKTGSLANNYCLSGFILTRKNRLLIFSSMNANFIEPTQRVRNNLEKILIHIYEHY